MVLLTEVNRDKSDPTRYLCVVVEIQNGAGTTLHREITPASAVQRWDIQWMSDGEVLLDSSDVGRYRIRKRDDGTWKGDFE